IGYHPSLLPRHRGRSSIEWAIRMRDTVTGGSVFWLNGGIDRGDVAAQDWCFVDPKLLTGSPRAAASILWREDLAPMGVALMRLAISDIMRGRIVRVPQDDRFSTWEPTIIENDIYRPDALMLTASNSEVTANG
ncbi:MAG: methionyl-tRNA formyltransferase, partial [bacterium]|nr:methionyl-tRNA formyltransferase [bacterium]